jgi:hypothetical protein
MKHLASLSFWQRFENLPLSIQDVARKNFTILKENPEHPSLHLKRIGRYRSVRIGKRYGALAVEVDEGLFWFWIGTHAEYDQLLKNA